MDKARDCGSVDFLGEYPRKTRREWLDSARYNSTAAMFGLWLCLIQAVDSLVQELCQGPAVDVTTVLRTALERGYRSDFQVKQIHTIHVSILM